MIWISLVCLLVLSSAAVGQSNYGVFSSSSMFNPKVFADMLPVEPATLPLSEADILCKGKPEGFVIVLLSGEKFVICTTDSKGDEFFCPKGLLYSDETKRCERKYNPNKNPCASQPCLNGGQCIPTQYTYQCQCASGYSGRTCELDASVCQQQQPCGQSFDSYCQSFRVGAALKHVCILQDGRAYGLNGQQAYANPCLAGEGIHPLAFDNRGFIMCDGDSMFIESCPGETIWDSLTKVCVWSDLPTTPIVSPMPMQFAFASSAPLPAEKPTHKPLEHGIRSGFSGSFGLGSSFGSSPSLVHRHTAAEISNDFDNSIPRASVTAFRSSLTPTVSFGGGGGGRSGGGGGGDSGGGGGSSDDFQRRTFTGGEFQPSSQLEGVARVIGGRPGAFSGAGLPGATSATELGEDVDRSTRGNFFDDDSNSASIPFRSRSGTINSFGNRGEFDPRSFVAGRPGALSGSNSFSSGNFPSNNNFRLPDAMKRSNIPNRF